MNDNNRLHGVRGWLLLFIIILVGISPLLALNNPIFFINTSKYYDIFLINNPVWSRYTSWTWCFIFLSIIWQWYVGYALIKKFEPSSIIKVKTFLIIKPILFFLKDFYFLSQLGILSFMPSLLFHTYTAPLIWLLYFTYSKRVKNTYLNDTISENKVDYNES